MVLAQLSPVIPTPFRRSTRAPTGPGLRDLAMRWLRPDADASLHVVRRGRFPGNRLRYVEIETLSGGRRIALLFFASRVRPGGWSVVPDRSS